MYQSAAAGADEVIMELDFGWTSDAEMSMIVHPMPHQAWLATPVVEILSKLIVVKVFFCLQLCGFASRWWCWCLTMASTCLHRSLPQ